MTIAPRPALSLPVERLRLRLRGAVQGVGMRPHVHGLAHRCGLSGFVQNGADGVTIEVEGATTAEFVDRLIDSLPPLCRIDQLDRQAIPPTGDTGFRILESLAGPVSTRAAADAATCPACLADLFDPASRFYRYPFVNCTHCGPRLTITRALPYDRACTAMADFPMCAACATDYADPANRRFHAEPIACPACGPTLDAPIDAIADWLKSGEIVALKGIGGYHLLCDARNPEAVATLRRRKGRDGKPFALMVANTASIGQIAVPTGAERALAATAARPIVLMQARPGAIPAGIAPGLTRVGVMLAYAPVHHLLFAVLAGSNDPEATNPHVLVATSANAGGDPLVVSAIDAATALAGIADRIVSHDRPILIRADDSLAQIVCGAPALLRRARGFVPEPIELAADGPDCLALGAHLKSTVTLTRGREAFVSPHIGDLDSVATVRAWRECIEQMQALLDVRPEIVAADLHPNYRSSQMAADFGRPVIAVQHHAAHLAAVAGEAQIERPCLGLALDGIGYGPAGELWGGEILRLAGADWSHLGGLEPLALPGGDRAARECWRMGVAALHRVGLGAHTAERFAGIPLAGPVAARLAAGREPFATSSLGRLFDAAAALLGVRFDQSYEGQAACELEALVRTPASLPDGWELTATGLSLAPLLRDFGRAPPDPATGAELFHGTLVAGLVALCQREAARTGLSDLLLGGGCLMNRVLAEGLVAGLSAAGLRPHLPRRLPANDGGVSFGQAVLARRMASAAGAETAHQYPAPLAGQPGNLREV